MGDRNQLRFVLDYLPRITGPILEIGSRDHGQGWNETKALRAHFPGMAYTGVDLLPGEGVDMVCNFANRTKVRRLGTFQTVICLSMLEHCANPFPVARNIVQVLQPHGLLFLSVPFMWRVHGHPDDYWRFTPSAIRVLFPTLREEAGFWTTKQIGVRRPLEETNVVAHGNTKSPYYLFPTLLNMLLVKP